MLELQRVVEARETWGYPILVTALPSELCRVLETAGPRSERGRGSEKRYEHLLDIETIAD